MALTPAEKLRAHNSPWSKYLNSVLQDQINQTSLSEQIHFNPARNAEFLALVRLAYIMVHGSDVPRPPTDSALSTWLSKKSRPTDHFKGQLQKAMKIFNGIASSNVFAARAFCPSKNLKQPKGVSTKGLKSRYSPVEWVLTAFLIIRHSSSTLQELAEAIRDFRDELNLNHHGEKKFSTKVFDRFRAWELKYFGIDSLSPRKRKRAQGENEDDELDELFEERDSDPPSQSAVSVREVKKQDRTVRKFASKLRSSGASIPASTKKYKVNGDSPSLEGTPSTSQIGQAMGWMTMGSPAQVGFRLSRA